MRQRFPPAHAGMYRTKTKTSPAHAGMYLSLPGPPTQEQCFPRTRGDVPSCGSGTRQASSFPPHTRGCTFEESYTEDREFVSPAHAGMYRLPACRSRIDPRFPRTRGDVPLSPPSPVYLARFPPHTRGCTRVKTDAGIIAGVSPAHAGMYPSKSL